jgi:hypothetical protein
MIMAIAIAVLAAGTTPGFGRTIKKKAAHEEKRIEGGKDSGRLTPKETERLENQQEIIDKERAQAAEDGKVTYREKRDIKHDQKRLSKDIYHKKHNKQHE